MLVVGLESFYGGFKMFFKKKPMNSEEYEKLAKRIVDLETELTKLSSSFLSLRGLIHRKATGDIEIPGKEKTINPDGLDELRDLSN